VVRAGRAVTTAVVEVVELVVVSRVGYVVVEDGIVVVVGVVVLVVVVGIRVTVRGVELMGTVPSGERTSPVVGTPVAVDVVVGVVEVVLGAVGAGNGVVLPIVATPVGDGGAVGVGAAPYA
jgi:hypothetical protein